MKIALAFCFVAVATVVVFHRSPDQLGPEQIRAYQVYLFTERKLNARTVGHHTAALRFFFCKTLKRAYAKDYAHKSKQRLMTASRLCSHPLLRLPRQPAPPRTLTTLPTVAASRPPDPFNNTDNLRAQNFMRLALPALRRHDGAHREAYPSTDSPEIC